MVKDKIYLKDALINSPVLTVSVYGSGGTGSHLVDKLAAIAYAFEKTTDRRIKLAVYDFDMVDPRNVARSDFTTGDIGFTKTQITVSKANIGYGLEWEVRNPFLTTVGQANFHFLCTDDAKSRLEYIGRILGTNQYGEPEDKSYYIFDVGNDKDFGQIVLLDKEGLLADIDRKTITSETVGTVTCADGLFDAQGLFVNQFMALCTAQMFWTFITDFNLEYSQLWVNLGMMKIISKLEWK